MAFHVQLDRIMTLQAMDVVSSFGSRNQAVPKDHTVLNHQSLSADWLQLSRGKMICLFHTQEAISVYHF